jgi:hypothetical protein
MFVSKQELVFPKGRPKAPLEIAKALTGLSGLDELTSGGNKDVEDFYNRFGWKVQSGQTGDAEL